METLSSGDDVRDDEDDSSGGYLPFAASSKHDPTSTLRNLPKRQAATAGVGTGGLGKSRSREQQPLAPVAAPPPDSSASSTTSSTHQQPDSNTDGDSQPSALSPKRRAQLNQLSPKYKRSGSEGSPSMGSSFSDLDDASVTQSALEEALLSNMQHGSIGMASRMSSLRDALTRR
jgi:hypothetical protein